MPEGQAAIRYRLASEIQFLRNLYTRIGIFWDEPEKKHLGLDTAARATVRRAMSGETRYITRAREFMPYIPEKSEWRKQKIWIPIAGLSTFYSQKISDSEKRTNFGRSFWLLQKEVRKKSPESKGTARRFRTLLDMSLEDIQTHLSDAVRQMKTREVAIDYPQLLSDLCQWEHPDQYIQDSWARSFWQVLPDSDANSDVSESSVE